MSVCLSLCMSVCMFVYMSVCICICMSVCLYMHTSVFSSLFYKSYISFPQLDFSHPLSLTRCSFSLKLDEILNKLSFQLSTSIRFTIKLQTIFKNHLFISVCFLSLYTSEKSSRNASKLNYLKSFRSACMHSPKHQHSTVSPGLSSLLQIFYALGNTFLVAWLDTNEYCQCIGCRRDRGNGGNGAGQTGRQCGRLEGGLGTCHSLACPVAKQPSNKQNTHITL